MVESCGEGVEQPPDVFITESVVSPQADDVYRVAVDVVSAQGSVSLGCGLAALDRIHGEAIERMRNRSGKRARVGETVRIHGLAGLVARRVLLDGLGAAADPDAAAPKNADQLPVARALAFDTRMVGLSADLHDAGVRSLSTYRITDAVTPSAREGIATRDHGGMRRLKFHLQSLRSRRTQAVLGVRQ